VREVEGCEEEEKRMRSERRGGERRPVTMVEWRLGLIDWCSTGGAPPVELARSRLNP
jgi:hypothetical protein